MAQARLSEHLWPLVTTGVWQRIHEEILRRLREHDQIMRDRASVDAASVPAPAGSERTGRNPTDRGKLGCKHHLLVDRRGLPLMAKSSGAQLHGLRLLIPLMEAIPAVIGLPSRARQRAGKLYVDRACASRAHRAWLRRRGIAARIALHGVESRERPGDGVGLSSAPQDGYIAFADCESGTSGEQTSIRRFLHLAARLSVGGTSSGFARRA
jgi:hypothetical protein